MELTSSIAGAGGWNETLTLSGSYPALAFNETGTSKHSRIGNDGDGSLSFFVNGTSSAVGTNAAVIDSSGNVGIGTSSPKTSLDIASSTGPQLTLTRTDSLNDLGDTLGRINFYNSDLSGDGANNAAIIEAIASSGTGAHADLLFRTKNTGVDGGDATEAMRIDASGNVGIGAAATSFGSGVPVLQLTGTASASPTRAGALRFRSQNGTSSVCDIYSDNGYMSFYTGTSTSTAERMRIDSSGNVGIGTTPSTDWGGNNVLQIGTKASFSSSSSFSGFATNLVATSSGWATKYRTFGAGSAYLQTTSDGSHRFYTAPVGSAGAAAAISERMRIDASGNVGIGLTNPSAPLHVNGDARIVGAYTSTTGFGANVFVQSTGKLFRSVSSARYKNSIEDATHGLEELLTLRPVTYKGNEDNDTVFGGLIAEEVHDVGLTEFVQYNEEGEPDALAYSNMVSLCIKAIQEQQTLIKSLTSRIAALEE